MFDIQGFHRMEVDIHLSVGWTSTGKRNNEGLLSWFLMSSKWHMVLSVGRYPEGVLCEAQIKGD